MFFSFNNAVKHVTVYRFEKHSMVLISFQILTYYPNGEPVQNVTVELHTSWYRAEFPSINGEVHFTIPNMPQQVQSVWIDVSISSLKS